MKVAIVGGMNIDDEALVDRVMREANIPIDFIITTEDDGVAKNVRAIAAKRNIPYAVYAPELNNLAPEKGKVEIRKDPKTGLPYNKRAPLNRNEKIVDDCDAFVMIWDGESAGCRSFLDFIKKDTTKSTYIVKIQRKK